LSVIACDSPPFALSRRERSADYCLIVLLCHPCAATCFRFPWEGSCYIGRPAPTSLSLARLNRKSGIILAISVQYSFE